MGSKGESKGESYPMCLHNSKQSLKDEEVRMRRRCTHDVMTPNIPNPLIPILTA